MSGLGFVALGAADERERMARREFSRRELGLREQEMDFRMGEVERQKQSALQQAAAKNIADLADQAEQIFEAAAQKGSPEAMERAKQISNVLRQRAMEVLPASGLDPNFVSAAFETGEMKAITPQEKAVTDARAAEAFAGAASVSMRNFANADPTARDILMSKLGISPPNKGEFEQLVNLLYDENTPDNIKPHLAARIRRLQHIESRAAPTTIVLRMTPDGDMEAVQVPSSGGSSPAPGGTSAAGSPGSSVGSAGTSGAPAGGGQVVPIPAAQQLKGGDLDRLRGRQDIVKRGIDLLDAIDKSIGSRPDLFGVTGAVTAFTSNLAGVIKDLSNAGLSTFGLDNLLAATENVVWGDDEAQQAHRAELERARQMGPGSVDAYQIALKYAIARGMSGTDDGRLLTQQLQEAEDFSKLRGWKSTEILRQRLQGVREIMMRTSADLSRRMERGTSGRAVTQSPGIAAVSPEGRATPVNPPEQATPAVPTASLVPPDPLFPEELHGRGIMEVWKEHSSGKIELTPQQIMRLKQELDRNKELRGG